MTAETTGAWLLAGTARTGLRPRPEGPTPGPLLAIAVSLGAFVVALAVIAAAVGRAAGVNIADQILFNTAVAIAYFLTVRSRPHTP